MDLNLKVFKSSVHVKDLGGRVFVSACPVCFSGHQICLTLWNNIQYLNGPMFILVTDLRPVQLPLGFHNVLSCTVIIV